MTVPPYYLMTCVWGELYCSYMLDVLIPSLLSPKNLPALKTGRESHRLAIATTKEDRARIEAAPILSRVRQYAEVVFHEIPPCPPDKTGCQHMGVGYGILGNEAYRARAHAAFMPPDSIMSDGALSWAQDQALAGAQCVLVASMRLEEESFFANMGARARSDILMSSGISGRELARTAVSSLHSEAQRYCWEAPRFSAFPVVVWWPVRDQGVILHTFSWAQILIDYGALPRHDDQTLREGTVDGDYCYRNFGRDSKGVVLAETCDDVMWVSWSPRAFYPRDTSPNTLHHQPVLGALVRGTILRNAAMSGVFDPMKKYLLARPIRWCWASDMDTAAWARAERRAMRILRFYLYGFDTWTPRRSPFALILRLWGRGLSRSALPAAEGVSNYISADLS